MGKVARTKKRTGRVSAADKIYPSDLGFLKQEEKVANIMNIKNTECLDMSDKRKREQVNLEGEGVKRMKLETVRTKRRKEYMPATRKSLRLQGKSPEYFSDSIHNTAPAHLSTTKKETSSETDKPPYCKTDQAKSIETDNLNLPEINQTKSIEADNVNLPETSQAKSIDTDNLDLSETDEAKSIKTDNVNLFKTDKANSIETNNSLSKIHNVNSSEPDKATISVKNFVTISETDKMRTSAKQPEYDYNLPTVDEHEEEGSDEDEVKFTDYKRLAIEHVGLIKVAKNVLKNFDEHDNAWIELVTYLAKIQCQEVEEVLREMKPEDHMAQENQLSGLTDEDEENTQTPQPGQEVQCTENVPTKKAKTQNGYSTQLSTSIPVIGRLTSTNIPVAKKVVQIREAEPKKSHCKILNYVADRLKDVRSDRRLIFICKYLNATNNIANRTGNIHNLLVRKMAAVLQNDDLSYLPFFLTDIFPKLIEGWNANLYPGFGLNVLVNAIRWATFTDNESDQRARKVLISIIECVQRQMQTGEVDPRLDASKRVSNLGFLLKIAIIQHNKLTETI